MGTINVICKEKCTSPSIRGNGILNVFIFCCEKGLQTIRKDIKKRYDL